MGEKVMLIVAILTICLLVAIFFITYILNKRTPVPKGCEDIRISEEKCSSCSHSECHFYQGEEK